MKQAKAGHLDSHESRVSQKHHVSGLETASSFIRLSFYSSSKASTIVPWYPPCPPNLLSFTPLWNRQPWTHLFRNDSWTVENALIYRHHHTVMLQIICAVIRVYWQIHEENQHNNKVNLSSSFFQPCVKWCTAGLLVHVTGYMTVSWQGMHYWETHLSHLTHWKKISKTKITWCYVYLHLKMSYSN